MGGLRQDLLDIVENAGRLPIVGGIPAGDLSIGCDENSRERVGESLVITRSNADIEELVNLVQLRLRGRGKVPVSEVLLGVFAYIGAAIAAQHLRSVVIRDRS